MAQLVISERISHGFFDQFKNIVSRIGMFAMLSFNFDLQITAEFLLGLFVCLYGALESFHF